LSGKNKTPREASLEQQVKVLADRLAIAQTILYDFELDHLFSDDGSREHMQSLQQIVLSDDNKTFKRLRKRWRKHSHYEQSLGKVKAMLTGMIRRTRQKRAA
jgi:hypothetical protein